jgi:hypothetical protein
MRAGVKRLADGAVTWQFSHDLWMHAHRE